MIRGGSGAVYMGVEADKAEQADEPLEAEEEIANESTASPKGGLLLLLLLGVVELGMGKLGVACCLASS